MSKPAFCIYENKGVARLAAWLPVVTTQLISVFVFATQIKQSLNMYFLNPKFKALSHLLWLQSPLHDGPRRKPQRQIFSEMQLIYVL